MPDGDRGARSPALAAQQSDGATGKQEAAQRNDATSDSKAGVVALPVEQAPGPNESAVANQQTQAEQANPYALRDLIAQEVMADAAAWMAVAAVLTFAVTSVGTFLIWRQVKLTREAVKDTGNATKAMLRQNELMEAAQRPYVVLECGDAPTPADDRGHVMPVNFRYANFGGTPAQILWQAHKIEVGESRNDLPAPLVPGGRGRKVPNGEVVGPNARTEFEPAGPIIHWEIELPTLAGMMKAPLELAEIFRKPTFFHGFVVYGDLEGRCYIRGFCFTYENGRFRLNNPSAEHNYDRRCNPDGSDYIPRHLRARSAFAT